MVEKKLEEEIPDDGFHKFMDSILLKVDENTRQLIKIDLINIAAEKVRNHIENDLFKYNLH